MVRCGGVRPGTPGAIVLEVTVLFGNKALKVVAKEAGGDIQAPSADRLHAFARPRLFPSLPEAEVVALGMCSVEEALAYSAMTV